jgi:hypothetical protein
MAIFSQELLDFLVSLAPFFQHPSELRLEFLRVFKLILKRLNRIQNGYKTAIMDDMLKMAYVYFPEFEDKILAGRFQSFVLDFIDHWLGEPSLSAKETLPVIKSVIFVASIDYYHPYIKPHLPQIFSKIFEIDFFMDHRQSSLKPQKQAINSLLAKLHQMFSNSTEVCFQVLYEAQRNPDLYEHLLFRIFVTKGPVNEDYHDKFVFILNSFMKDFNNIPNSKRALKLLRVHKEMLAEFSVSFLSQIFAFLKNLLLKDIENDLGICSKVSILLRDLTLMEKFNYKFGNLAESFLEFLDFTDLISNDDFAEFITTLIK